MKSVFITGSGQCGETFVLNLFSKNNKILAKDESRPFLHSYYKFLKFNKLNVDDAPLLNQIGKSIKKTNSKGKIYLVSSSFLALLTSDIIKKFKSKFLILLRNPIDVAYSLKKKGWYELKYIKGSKNKIIGYQGLATNVHNKHHNFCRLSPRDNYFYEWNKLDQLTKIKWYWDTIYKNIFLDLKKMPNRDYKIVKIEDIDYEKYKDIAKWIGVKPTLNKFFFNMKINIIKKNHISRKKKDLKKLKKFKSEIEKMYYKENIDNNNS